MFSGEDDVEVFKTEIMDLLLSGHAKTFFLIGLPILRPLHFFNGNHALSAPDLCNFFLKTPFKPPKCRSSSAAAGRSSHQQRKLPQQKQKSR